MMDEIILFSKAAKNVLVKIERVIGSNIET